MTVRFLSEARAELDDAAFYYESVRQGLGDALYAEIDAAFAFIVHSPNACPPSALGCRRKKVHRFPYYLIYAVRDGEIIITAVAHTGRDPAYWHNRLL